MTILLKLNHHLFIQTVAGIALLLGTSSPAFSAAVVVPVLTSADFFATPPEAVPEHSNLELNKIFTSGMGRYSPSMSLKLYPYLLPQNSTFGAPLYNGCYDKKNNRLGDLDSANSCAAVIAANPGISVFRLFLGYKVGCSSSPIGSTCPDMSLFMNCQYTQEALGTGSLDVPVSMRQCSSGNPIVHKARANAEDVPKYLGCLPGQDGTTYVECKECTNGKFNDTIGANRNACKTCSVLAMTGSPTMPHSLTQPTTFDTFPASGATAGAQCLIKPTDPWTCEAAFEKTADNQLCVPRGACALSLTITPTNPSSPTATNGKIVAAYSAEVGTVSGFAITSPTNILPTSVSGATGIFSGLSQNTYRVSVTDSTCTSSTNITLGSPSPSPTPKIFKCVATSCHLGHSETTTCYTDGTFLTPFTSIGTCSDPMGQTYMADACDACSVPKVVKCNASFCHLGNARTKTCYTDGTSGNDANTGVACAVEQDPNSANVFACNNPAICAAPPVPPVIKCIATWCHLNYMHTSTCYTNGTNTGYGANGGTCIDDGQSAIPCNNPTFCDPLN